MIIIWKNHPRHNLQISNTGLVRGKDGTPRRICIDAKGYAHSCTFKVHRLVAETFIDNPLSKPAVTTLTATGPTTMFLILNGVLIRRISIIRLWPEGQELRRPQILTALTGTIK